MRVTVIPNAVDPSEFRPARPPDPALRAKLGLESRTQAAIFSLKHPQD